MQHIEDEHLHEVTISDKRELQGERIRTAFMVAQTIVGHGQEILLYGGAVRNYLLGTETSKSDFDFIGDFNPDIIEEQYPELCTDRWDNCSTLRLNIGQDAYDFTWTKDITKRLSVGDITISNIAMTEDFEIVDPFNAQSDLIKRQIRVTEPDKKFQQDPSRILRVLRFSGELEFDIEEETFQAIQRNKSLLETTDIKEELLQIYSLSQDKFTKVTGLMFKLGLETFFPLSIASEKDLETLLLERKLNKLKELEQINQMFTCPTFLVGGAIRDTIWGKRTNDLDFKIFTTLEEVIKILEQNNYKRSEDYRTKPGQYYVSKFPGVIGFNMNGKDIHLSTTNTIIPEELIAQGDINFNCCIYDIHSKEIKNPEIISEIKNKVIYFANTDLAYSDPTIIINALKQISRIPEIVIPEETESVIYNSMAQVVQFIRQNPEFFYLLRELRVNLNSNQVYKYFHDLDPSLFKKLPRKRELLQCSNPGFISKRISDLTREEKDQVKNIIQNGYKDSFDEDKFLDPEVNSVLLHYQNGRITSCCLMDGERLYSASASSRIEWVRLVSELVQNNYNLWATIRVDDKKILALCELSGMKIEGNPNIIRKILQTKSTKYNNLLIEERNGQTIFKKADIPDDYPQILVRS